MRGSSAGTDGGLWNPDACRSLIDELSALRAALLAGEKALARTLAKVDPSFLPSARHPVHCLELRRVDLRPLQDRLARLGISSLGRSESHVPANINKALGILPRLAGPQWSGRAHEEPAGVNTSKPGPASLSEAVHLGLPVVTVRNAWTMLQERYNAEWVREHGLGVAYNSFRTIRPAVDEVIRRLPERQRRLRAIDNRAVFEVPEILAWILGGDAANARVPCHAGGMVPARPPC